ncbi:hypothetical protein KA111_02465 [Candidatus Woesebacteria bacterium]|nr:hypothetical protein [Candidatus Woesebacteria bacterium]
MKKNNFFKLLIIFIFIVSGCTKKPLDSKESDGLELLNSGSEMKLEDKNSETSITGKISKSGDLYLISTAQGKTQDLESYSINFDNYVGKTITVVGEFSGNTLFVTEVK